MSHTPLYYSDANGGFHQVAIDVSNRDTIPQIYSMIL